MAWPGLAWCRRVVEHAEDWDSDTLINLFITAMLRMKPREWLPAGAYLTKACELGLFDDPSADLGGTTTTRRIAPVSGAQNEEENLTVVAGPLWDAGRGRSIHDSKDQAGPSASDFGSSTSTSRPPSPDGSVDASDEENSTHGFFSEEGRLPVGTNVTCPHARESNESSDAVLLRQSNNEAEKNHPEGSPSRKPPSCYSYRDFVPPDSPLQEVKLRLQTPSRTSSRYGSALARLRDLGFDVDEMDV